MTASRSPVVVLSGHVTGLWVARALAAEHFRVWTLPVDRHCLARSSGVVDEVLDPHRGGPRGLASRLLDDEQIPEGSTLVPTTDVGLEALSRHRDALEPRFQIMVPPWNVVRRLLRKDVFRRTASGLGIPMPVHHGAIETASVREMDFPVCCKPSDGARFSSRFGRKVLVAWDAGEFHRARDLMAEAELSAEVQELVSGPDTESFNWTAYYDRSGVRRAEFPIRKVRKAPPFYGIGRVVRRCNDDEVTDAMRERIDLVVRAVGWHGPLSAEFKRDPETGRLLLIEINGRCSFVQQLAWRHGVNYPVMLAKEARGEEVSTVQADGEPGTLIHLRADLTHALVSRRQEQVGWQALVRPYRERPHFAVWSRSDPWPFAVEWARTLLDTTHRLRQAIRLRTALRRPDRAR